EREVVVAVPREMRRPQQLEADEHRVQATDEDERADPDEVLEADHLVVGAEAEVASDSLGLLLTQRGRLAEHPLHRVVREAQPDEEADDPDEVRDEQRDVVLARVVEVGEARRLDQVPEPPPDVEADDPEHDRRQEVEADQAAELHPARKVGSGAYDGAYFGRYFWTGANWRRRAAIHVAKSAALTTRPVSDMYPCQSPQSSAHRIWNVDG